MAGHYKDLIAWQKGMDLVTALYDATEEFPKRETYSLTVRCVGRPYPSRVISLKVKLNIAILSFVIFFGSRVDLWQNLKPMCSLLREEIICPNHKRAELIKRANKVGRILSGLIDSLKQRTTA